MFRVFREIRDLLRCYLWKWPRNTSCRDCPWNDDCVFPWKY